jgi:hypothetical protein
MKRNIFLLFVFFTLHLSIDALYAQVNSSASPKKEKKAVKQFKFTVEAAPEWTALFQRSDGWFGGDGIFSIPLNGVEAGGAEVPKTLFVFSDSMIGEIKDGKLQPGSKMIHNSTALLKGLEPQKEQLSFYWNNTDKGDAESVFVPKTPQTGAKDYYWLGDGFVNQSLDNAIFIFGYRVRNVSEGTFGFEEAGNTLIKIRADQGEPYNRYDQKDTPFYYSKEMGSFGAGILVNTRKAGVDKGDKYVYVYGVRGKAKKLLVARVLPKDFENYAKWMYWDGLKWNPDMQQAKAVTDGVSNELSISPIENGKFALIFQEGGMGKYVAMRIGSSPIGPFGPPIRLWDCSAALTRKTYFSYNAKAHPSLSKKGELLISYNINSFDFFKDLEIDPQLYRPRFIKVKFD